MESRSRVCPTPSNKTKNMHGRTEKGENREPLTLEERQAELEKGRERLFESRQEKACAGGAERNLFYHRLGGECYIHRNDGTARRRCLNGNACLSPTKHKHHSLDKDLRQHLNRSAESGMMCWIKGMTYASV